MSQKIQYDKINTRLHPKQLIAFLSKATEILFGGAAGPGKSHLVRVLAIALCVAVPNLQVYLFRRIREDLIKSHMEGPTGFRSLLAPWIGKFVEIVEDEIRFWNGARIYLCHCKDEKDRLKYLSAEIHVLLIDELTQFTEVIYRFLRSRVRMPLGMKIPDVYKDKLPCILCASNPGGVGHQWVKATWVDSKPSFEIWETPDGEGGFLRQFIPARLSDNPSIDQEAYASNLSGLGNEALVKAMLDGDWDVVAGAALNINRAAHMVRSFTPPKHWTRFSSLDWGYVKPYANGWYCVADEDTELAAKDEWPDCLIPKGAVILYRELYGSTGKPDEGVREESEIVVEKILAQERTAGERMDYRIADTQLWAKNDGPSAAERMINRSNVLVKDGRALQDFNPRPCEKDRQSNYQEICARLKGIEIGDKHFLPMFYITANCLNWWRTVPPLVLDEVQPEKGPDEKQELHSYDHTQYALISRPFISTAAGRNEALFWRNRKLMKESADPYRMKKVR